MGVQGKNQALKEAGAIVPASFEGLESTVARVYKELVADGTIQPRPEPTPPTVPQDLAVAQKAGLVRTIAPSISPPYSNLVLAIKVPPSVSGEVVRFE